MPTGWPWNIDAPAWVWVLGLAITTLRSAYWWAVRDRPGVRGREPVWAFYAAWVLTGPALAAYSLAGLLGT